MGCRSYVHRCPARRRDPSYIVLFDWFQLVRDPGFVCEQMPVSHIFHLDCEISDQTMGANEVMGVGHAVGSG